MRRPAHLLITIARDARSSPQERGERLRRGAADLGEQGERVGERGFQLCGGAGGIEPCGRIRLQEQCVFRQLARVGAPAPGREHALVDRDEAPERAQAVQVLAAARKPVEDAGRVRGRPWRSRMSSASVAACTAWMDTTRPARGCAAQAATMRSKAQSCAARVDAWAREKSSPTSPTNRGRRLGRPPTQPSSRRQGPPRCAGLATPIWTIPVGTAPPF